MESRRGYQNSRKKIKARRGSEPAESEPKARPERPKRVTSESPPPDSPRVVLLRPTQQASQVATNSSSQSLARSVSPEYSSPTPDGSSLATHLMAASPIPVKPPPRITCTSNEETKPSPEPPSTGIKLIDLNTWSFMDRGAEYMSGEGSTSFKVVSVIGSQSSGKSSLLNFLAGQNVFRAHGSDTYYLQHITEGVDMFITNERLFLLDTQPILSASLLDELISNNQIQSHICSSDVMEPDAIFIASVQMVAFLLSNCDSLIVTTEWNLDIHVVKLISTALMMLRPTPPTASLIWFLGRRVSDQEAEEMLQSISLLLGLDNMCLINGDKSDLLTRVLRSNTCRNGGSPAADGLVRNAPNPLSEKHWFASAQRFWENSVKKTNLYTDFVRLIK